MFFPEARVRVFLFGQPVDMRKSFDGLITLTGRALGQDPLSGHVFTFVNRRGNYLKALYLRIPRQSGHRFHRKLDTDSTANWTGIPGQTGHLR